MEKLAIMGGPKVKTTPLARASDLAIAEKKH